MYISVKEIRGISRRKDIQSIFFANLCLFRIEFSPSIELKVGINAEWNVSPERDCWNENGSLRAMINIFDNIPDPRKAAINISLIKPEICEKNINNEFMKEFFAKSIL
tara:strand:+ start:2702 stop:3025 length:324 start_codon:yes stop_codon:yes gene_type:complete